MKETLPGSAYNEVLNSLRRVHRAKLRTRIAEESILSLSVVVIVVLLAAVLDMVFNFGVAARTVLFAISVAAVVFAILKLLLPDFLRYVRPVRVMDLMEAALEAGEAYPELRDRLRNAVELMSEESGEHHSQELAAAFISRTFDSASSLRLESAVRHHAQKRPAYFLGASLLAGLLLMLSFPSGMPAALQRVFNFTHRYVVPQSYLIRVSPGTTELSRGDTLRIRVRLTLLSATSFPSDIIVREKYRGEKEFESHRARETEDGTYGFLLPNVINSLTYFVDAGNQRSNEYNVKVVDLPIVKSFRVRLAYPQYTGRMSETLQDNIGDFTALVGTHAEFKLNTNKPLKAAWIAFNDSTDKNLEISGKEASGSFMIRHTTVYRLKLLDSDSLMNRDPISYTIRAVRDQYPTCEITYPGKNVVLNRDMILPLRITIGDDYGFTKLLLQYKLVSSKYAPPEKDYHSIEIPLPSRSAGQEDISYTWDLTSRNLVPEDVISYHARVFDNDMVDGPKSTASSEYTLRLPSLEEAFASADTEHSDLVAKTEDALSSSDELQQQLNKISEEMKTATKQMSWEQKKKMENTVERYDSLQKKVEGIKKQIENMTQKMLANKIISPQTLEKYLELQKALQDMDSPEFQEALRKLQQAIQSLNPNLIREAMKDFQINDEMLRRSIERTLSLIKRIQVEQKFDELQARLEQMLSHQEKLEKETARSDSTSGAARARLSENQREIEKELAATREAASRLQKLMEEFSNEMPVRQLENARQALDSSGAAEMMRKAGRQLSGGNFSQSMANQRLASSALQKFRQQISQAQKAMLQNQQMATVNALRKAQQNLLEISKEQEALRERSGNVMPYSAETRTLSDRQNQLMQQLGYTAQQMMQLSDRSFSVTPEMGRQIGEAYSRMEQALSKLQSRSGESPTGSQSEAMGALNEAAMNIQSTLQSMMQGQGGGFPSLMQQLEGLGARQEGLNAITRELAEQGALSMQQQAEMARLAARQEAIRKTLQQLAQEAEQSRTQNRILGNLNDIAKEMKDVIGDMHNRNITQETIRRQERILTHLLDASRSIRQQNYDNKRVTRAGKDIMVQSPGPLNLSNSQSAEERQLLKLIRDNFPPEYQKVIIRYYRLLQKKPE